MLVLLLIQSFILKMLTFINLMKIILTITIVDIIIVFSFQELPLEPIGENGFYCSTAYYNSMFEKVPGFENDDFDLMFEYLSKVIGNTYTVTFEFGDYKFSKDMVLKGIITWSSVIVIPEDLYESIITELGIRNIDFIYNTVLTGYTVNKNIFPEKSYRNFIKTLNDRDDYTF